MRLRRHRCEILILVATAGALIAPLTAVADNNITYNFNQPNGRELGWFGIPDASGTVTPYWDWNLGSSGSGGGFQAFTGSDPQLSSAFLLGPCLVLDNNKDWVNVKVTHRYDFPLSLSGTANQLGQVQFRIDSGAGWGAWRGVPSAYFVTFTGSAVPDNYVPNYGPPTRPLFGPLIDSSTTPPAPVLAWSGSTPAFAGGAHETSEFTLFYGDFGLASLNEIQFRFAMATNEPTSGTNRLVWEVNSIQIEGVVPCVVPEPGGLALAGIGAIGCLVIVGRRRGSRALAALARSTAVAILVAAVIVGTLAAVPARAASTWDFELSNGGWTQSGASPFIIPPGNRWTWSGTASGTTSITGGSSPHWRIVAQGMPPPYSSSHLLTSPVFSGLSGTIPAQNARISIAHEFFYATGTSGRPINLGQLQYRLNGSGPWIGLPLTAFTSGSSVIDDDLIFGPSPFKPLTVGGPPQYVDQTSYLAPTYLTPTGSAALPVVSGSAAAFLGASPFWPGDYYVPSQAFLNANTGLPASGISSLELRFTNLNLAGNCTDEGWNIRFVQVDFDTGIPPVPEPATVALGATGLVTLVAAGAIRRRLHQRPSRPSESP